MQIDDGVLRQILREEAQNREVNSPPRILLESLIERLDVIVSAQPIKDPEPVFDPPEVGYVSDPMEGGYVFADPTEGGRGFAIGGFINGPAAGLMHPGKIHEVHGGPVTCWCGHPAFMPTRAVGCDLDYNPVHDFDRGITFAAPTAADDEAAGVLDYEPYEPHPAIAAMEQTAHSGGPVINRDTLPPDSRIQDPDDALSAALIEDGLLHSAQDWTNEVERITVMSGGSFGYGQRSDDLGRPLHSPVGQYQPTDQPQAEPPHAYLQHAADTDRHRVVLDFGVDILGAERFTAWFNEGDWRPVPGHPVPAGPTSEQAAAMLGFAHRIASKTDAAEDARLANAAVAERIRQERQRAQTVSVNDFKTIPHSFEPNRMPGRDVLKCRYCQQVDDTAIHRDPRKPVV